MLNGMTVSVNDIFMLIHDRNCVSNLSTKAVFSFSSSLSLFRALSRCIYSSVQCIFFLSLRQHSQTWANKRRNNIDRNGPLCTNIICVLIGIGVLMSLLLSSRNNNSRSKIFSVVGMLIHRLQYKRCGVNWRIFDTKWNRQK